jgi:hypothetical protein
MSQKALIKENPKGALVDITPSKSFPKRSQSHRLPVFWSSGAQAELVSRVIGDHFARFGGHLSQPPAPDCVLTPIQFLGQFPLRTTKK